MAIFNIKEPYRFKGMKENKGVVKLKAFLSSYNKTVKTRFYILWQDSNGLYTVTNYSIRLIGARKELTKQLNKLGFNIEPGKDMIEFYRNLDKEEYLIGTLAYLNSDGTLNKLRGEEYLLELYKRRRLDNGS